MIKKQEIQELIARFENNKNVYGVMLENTKSESNYNFFEGYIVAYKETISELKLLLEVSK